MSSISGNGLTPLQSIMQSSQQLSNNPITAAQSILNSPLQGSMSTIAAFEKGISDPNNWMNQLLLGKNPSTADLAGSFVTGGAGGFTGGGLLSLPGFNSTSTGYNLTGLTNSLIGTPVGLSDINVFGSLNLPINGGVNPGASFTQGAYLPGLPTDNAFLTDLNASYTKFNNLFDMKNLQAPTNFLSSLNDILGGNVSGKKGTKMTEAILNGTLDLGLTQAQRDELRQKSGLTAPTPVPAATTPAPAPVTAAPVPVPPAPVPPAPVAAPAQRVIKDSKGTTNQNFTNVYNQNIKFVGDNGKNTFKLGGSNNYFEVHEIGGDDTIELTGPGWQLVNDGNTKDGKVTYKNILTGSTAVLITDHKGAKDSFVTSKVEING